MAIRVFKASVDYLLKSRHGTARGDYALRGSPIHNMAVFFPPPIRREKPQKLAETGGPKRQVDSLFSGKPLTL
jgi:hypothetical protein